MLREVQSTLTQMRTLCREPTKVQRKLQSLVKDVEDAETVVVDLPPVTPETLREVRSKLEMVFRILDVIGGHIARPRELTDANYWTGLSDLVSVLATKLDDAIDFVTGVADSLGTSALRRRAHPRAINVPIDPNRGQVG